MPLSADAVQNVKKILDASASEGPSGAPGLVCMCLLAPSPLHLFLLWGEIPTQFILKFSQKQSLFLLYEFFPFVLPNVKS